jgi:hypothetical protein
MGSKWTRGGAARAARTAAIVLVALAAGWLARSLSAPAPGSAPPPPGAALDAAAAEQTIWTCARRRASLHPAQATVR